MKEFLVHRCPGCKKITAACVTKYDDGEFRDEHPDCEESDDAVTIGECACHRLPSSVQPITLQFHPANEKPLHDGTYLCVLDNHCEGGTVVQLKTVIYSGWLWCTGNFEGEVVSWAALPDVKAITARISSRPGWEDEKDAPIAVKTGDSHAL